MEPLFFVQSCSTVQSQAATAHHPSCRNAPHVWPLTASRALISQPSKFQQGFHILEKPPVLYILLLCCVNCKHIL
ncbi:hypothetical protein S83_050525 [Arachis hypogaea]